MTGSIDYVAKDGRAYITINRPEKKNAMTSEMLDQLMTGYDRAYGARPLKRAIQRLIQDPLAIKILDGEVLHGDHVKVDADPLNNRLVFEVAGKKAAKPAKEKVGATR